MGILKRNNSKYWYIQFQYNGRTYIKSSKTSDRKLAETMENEWRRQLAHDRVFGTKERVSIRNALCLYTDSKKELASHRNIVRNASVLSLLLSHRNFLDEIYSSDLERIRLDRQNTGYSNQTIKHLMGVMQGCVKYMSRMGYKTPDLEYPRITLPKGKLRYLSFEEEKRLLTANDPKRAIKGMPPFGQRPANTQREMDDLYDFLILLLDTGARYSEIANLTWANIDLSLRTILLWRPKVKNESILYMTARVHHILQNRFAKKTSDFLFENSKGSARNYIPSTLRRAFDRADLYDCSPHSLRHTHATRLIQNGLSIYEVKEILGHADIKTTMRYAHIEQRMVSMKAREVIDRLNQSS